MMWDNITVNIFQSRYIYMYIYMYIYIYTAYLVTEHEGNITWDNITVNIFQSP
jgi:hypothetical protein